MSLNNNNSSSDYRSSIVYERSYSPLIRDTDEAWKVTSQRASSTGRIKKKPLPAIPTASSIFQPQNNYYHNNNIPYPTTPTLQQPGQDPYYNYYYQQQQLQQYPIFTADLDYNAVEPQSNYYNPAMTPPITPNSTASFENDINEQNVPQQTTPASTNMETHLTEDRNVRQIRVKSINNDYLVWITVEPKETGESLAEKIHTIATFRTRKILTVTTASGRNVQLDKTPVFKKWEDMEDFKNGETWSVTWGPLKRSMMDKILSKFIES
ncbi:MAG: hypothetical protein EXX96DRAFT_16710 [Benjaminiella poitrasii]|nr:MAG: hypothetical protein EXX96DRAFT_16710 [Benjaminiella poitrasii]